MKTETMDSLGAAGTKAVLLGAGTAAGGWLTASEFAAVVGALVAIGGLLLSWHYKRAANARHVAEHELRQRERQLRIDLMQAAGRPIPAESDIGRLECDE